VIEDLAVYEPLTNVIDHGDHAEFLT